MLRVCPEDDETCATPYTEAPFITNEDGLALVGAPVNSPRGFIGFVEISHDVFPIENLACFVPPVAGAAGTRDIHAFSRHDMLQIYGALGEVYQPNDPRGSIGLIAFDCQVDPLAGARVSVDGVDPAHVVYFAGDVADPSRDHTDATAIVVAIHVPAGAATVRLWAGDAQIASARVLVRGGAVTTLPLPPTPSGDWW